jgi:indole-3-glycerol phosphate synthase
MTILDQIIVQKYREVKERKALYPSCVLEKSPYFMRNTISLKQSLQRRDKFGIIAEFKRRSPSKGILNVSASPEKVCREYFNSGCSAISVLTDSDFFGGSSTDIIKVRKNVNCPVLQKDFIVDEYQIIEAKSFGADAILLIAEVHPAEKIERFYRFARSLDLEVLVEVHNETNFSKIPSDAQIVGINSRDLESFKVDLDHLNKMINLLPKNVIKVAESGIQNEADYLKLKSEGFDAFLIGELFMRAISPGKACTIFIKELKNIITPSVKLNSPGNEKN